MVQNNSTQKIQPHNYEDQKLMIIDFLKNFQSKQYKIYNKDLGHKKYLQEIQLIIDKKSDVLSIHLEDLEEFFLSKGEKFKRFLKAIKTNTKRYIALFTEVANSFDEIRRRTQMTEEEEFDNALEMCRMENLDKNKQEQEKENMIKVKKLLNKKFEVKILPGPNAKKQRTKLRNLKASLIGQMVNVRATVVKISAVQPLMDMACYICENCQWECYKKINSSEFVPPAICDSQQCKDNRNQGNMVQNFAMSRFVQFQELKIQEISEETPIGSIPRTYTVYARGNNVRTCTPGDVVDLCGIFLAKPTKRFMKNDQLVQETFIEALNIRQVKETYSKLSLTKKEMDKLIKDSQKRNNLSKLTHSIAPEIFGMENVKKALLLQMVGGSTIDLPDGMKIRGDLNIALIGDPGVAKSQLLKFITHITPRGIYTTGKGSSGTGLTASIMRDPLTNEITLEGGALVLSDKGICCIDEFDKMEENDRVAIHEVMEQQTVSLAKAGITTRLNARTSILAAANPVQGRYNKKKSPHENINLPYSLLSRFDLIFILLDTANAEQDNKLAQHITYVHRNKCHPKLSNKIYTEKQLKNYISHAKTFNPTIEQSLHEFVVNKYVEKRKLNKQRENQKEYAYVTPRSLLGIIRLSQALAKLRFSNHVNKVDIEDAINLMESAQASILEENEEENFRRMKLIKQDKNSQIYYQIRQLFKAKKQNLLNLETVENKILSLGFTLKDFKATLDGYQEMGLIIFNEDKTQVSLIQLSQIYLLESFWRFQRQFFCFFYFVLSCCNRMIFFS